MLPVSTAPPLSTVLKQHLVKVILFANILIGPAHPGQFASKISIKNSE